MNRRHWTASLPNRALIAVLLSALLITSSALAGHSHDDGLAHYADCDICLQAGSLDAGHETGVALPPLRPATSHQPDYRVSAAAPIALAPQARAPPLSLSL